MSKKVSILGTEYSIETHKVSEDVYMRENRLAGYCSEDNKQIIIADVSEEEFFVGMDEKAQKIYYNKTLRHEIIHAFLNESGLSDCASVPVCAWSKHEEMVDWIAIQFPKIQKVYVELGCDT